jgi:beta-glucanase (GH16 family)
VKNTNIDIIPANNWTKFLALAIPFFLLIFVFSCSKEDVDEEDDGYSLTWSDEFNEADIDTMNWNFETGDGRDYGLPAGWGNNELQIYTTEVNNIAIIEDDTMSVLSITALEDGNGGYTSSKITTKDKVSIRFGRIEVRAKMPQGQGIWPAIWMLGDNNDEVDWPGCGEIDIAEVLGHEPSTYHSTLHYTNGNYGKGELQESFDLSSGTFSDDYHIFSAEWTDQSIIFSVDEVEIGNIPIEEDMKEFQRSFYFIMNVAVGGYWPGNPDNTTTLPQSMFVDYIRVYSKDNYAAPAAPALIIEEETLGGNLPPDIGNAAIREDFTLFGDVGITGYGITGVPDVYVSDVAIDGDKSIVYNFPGVSWGGAWFELESGVDISGYSNLHFSVKMPEELYEAEIKLESSNSAAAIFIENYESVPVEDGFVEYKIPLSDFEGLDLSNVHIPFAFWNPKDENESYVRGEVFIDNIYLE